jgi:predicted DNA-binding protein
MTNPVVSCTTPRRWLAMSEQASTATAGSGQLRTLAVRINEDLRAQLDIIAQLTGRSATEEIRLALEHWIEKVKSDPVMLQKAAAVQAEIERSAQTQRKAIAAIFGGDGAKSDADDATSPRTATRRPKSGGE